MNTIKIGDRTIGDGQPLYFIADIGANHDGDLQRAYKLIELAKEAGADAAKFQNFKAPKIVSKFGFEHLPGQLSHQSNWKKSVYEVYEDASLNDDWTILLKEKCDEFEIDYFTSAYDFDSVNHAEPYVDVYKIGSGDITWIEILEHTAKKGKPVMIATGASSMQDVERAYQALTKHTNEIVLMQCNTNYTLDPDKFQFVNLNVLKAFKKQFPNAVLGLSDHTFGHATVLGAIALGACVFEKHFTDDNSRTGPDHSFAMNPSTWKEMVVNSNQLFQSLGNGEKKIEDNEKDSMIVQRRCLRAASDLTEGSIIEYQNLIPLRPIPDDGIEPFRLKELIGKKLLKSLKQGEHITENHIK